MKERMKLGINDYATQLFTGEILVVLGNLIIDIHFAITLHIFILFVLFSAIINQNYTYYCSSRSIN